MFCRYVCFGMTYIEMACSDSSTLRRRKITATTDFMGGSHCSRKGLGFEVKGHNI